MHPGKIVCSFGLGSKKLYDAVDGNPDISSQPVDLTNLPHLIMQNDRLTTINNTTQMDLQGQAARVRRSRIVLDLTPGNVVTAPRSDMMYVVTEYVVTEYGIVNLKGKSVPERATAMISLAHPDFRDDLEREARGNGLIPRSFR